MRDCRPRPGSTWPVQLFHFHACLKPLGVLSQKKRLSEIHLQHPWYRKDSSPCCALEISRGWRVGCRLSMVIILTLHIDLGSCCLIGHPLYIVLQYQSSMFCVGSSFQHPISSQAPARSLRISFQSRPLSALPGERPSKLLVLKVFIISAWYIHHSYFSHPFIWHRDLVIQKVELWKDTSSFFFHKSILLFSFKVFYSKIHSTLNY